MKLNSQNGLPVRFHLGRVVATPGALAVLAASGQLPHELVVRHAACDWGDVDAHDRRANDEAIAYEGNPERQERVLSAYRTRRGDRIWIITEADRSATTLLLPEEY